MHIVLAVHYICGYQIKLTCIRVVTNVENPNPLIIMVPKFEIPPLGILPMKMLVNATYFQGWTWHKSHTNHAKNKEHVELVVLESLQNLIWLEMLIFNTSLIFSYTLDSHAALSLGKTFCCNG